MELIKFVLWLTVGAVIGWFASRITMVERMQTHKLMPREDRSSEKS